MANRYGLLSFKADGEQFSVIGDFEIKPDTRGGEPQTSHDGVTGFVETFVPGEVIGTVLDSVELDVKRLKNLKDVTLTIEQANGKVWVGRNATQTNMDGLNPLNGHIPVSFVCDSLEELGA